MNNKIESNEDLKVDTAGDYLQDKNIALCITGGIAAIETPKIVRHLRRYGANVKAYMTTEAQKFVGVDALRWATEQEVITKLSGSSEHISNDDLILVAPATTNTINKIFYGIADNSVTTLVASALGMNKKILLAPTMHESLYKNPFLQENLNRAEQYGIGIIEPRIGEGKAKIPKLETIVAEVSRELSDHPIKDKRLLITGGPTPVWIDDVRMISNRFKGSLAKRIANEAYLRGAEVKLLLGNSGIKIPTYIDTLVHEDFDQYKKNVMGELGRNESNFYDAGIFSAAVADYQPVEKYDGKIPSQGAIDNIPLKQTSKVIKEVRENFPKLYMVTFKYEDGISVEELLGIAKNRINNGGYQLVIANRAEDMKTNHEAYMVSNNSVEKLHSSQEIASRLVDYLGNQLKCKCRLLKLRNV